MNSLDYAKCACDTLMNEFTVEELPPAMGFHYHQGVFLGGMEEVFKQTGDKKYYDYIKAWVDLFIDENATLLSAKYTHFDDLQPLNLCFNLYDIENDSRYFEVIKKLIPRWKTWKTNSKGAFWHKMPNNPNQVWLDCLYMSGPLAVRYAARSGECEYIDLILKQLELMWENMRCERNGLLYHCWDETIQEPWADKMTGLSACFWGRSIGWIPAAIVDMLEVISPEHYAYDKMKKILTELLASVRNYQDEDSGMWYQLLNCTNDPNNWLESSCSCLFAYSMAKAVRLKLISADYAECAKKAYDGIIKKSVEVKDGKFILKDICIGTGVCTYEEYLARPRSENDLHGVGAFAMMCCEIARL